MLTQLVIKNFALIDALTIDFAAGFNVLTGETGAGKSILIDAFGAALGGRMSVEQIRQGADACLVEAIFDLSAEDALRLELEELSGSLLEDGKLFLLRRYGRTGKRNLISVNGVQVPLAVLRQIGERLVEIHGQHESQRLLRPSGYLGILDAYAADKLAKLAPVYRECYQKWQTVKKQVQQARNDEAERERKLDMLRWQTKEISEAGLSTEEEAVLQQESMRLANWEKTTVAVQQANDLLDDNDGGLLTSLHELHQTIGRIGRVEKDFADFVEPVKDAAYLLEELKELCTRYANETEFDPKRVEQVGERLDLYYRLKRKYGPETEDVKSFLQRAERDLQQLGDLSDNIAAWQKEADKLEAQLQKLSAELTLARTAAAKRFSSEMTHELQALAMQAAVFTVTLTTSDVLGAEGCDKVAFLFSANAGMEPAELSKVASGGELSRIALALKRILVEMKSLPVTVFDEIDSGVGGLTALKMAEQIAAVAVGRQVLCVTHLPQIACMADHQLVIEKMVVSGRTLTTVRSTDDESRIQELVRMIAGEQFSPAATEAAKEMLREARVKKGR